MPENVTAERTELLRMYGAEIVYSEGSKGSNGAVEMALEMAEKDPSFYMPYQYGNQANPDAHYYGTARRSSMSSARSRRSSPASAPAAR